MTRAGELDSVIARFTRWADAHDPAVDASTVEVDDMADLREIAEAAELVRAAEREERDAVERARARGRSWAAIGMALGITRQGARQRFAPRTPPSL